MANFKISNILPDSLVPKDIPKGLILTLIIVIMLMSLSAYRYGNGNTMQGILHVLENWVLYLVLIPSCTALVSLPIKYRDNSFDVRMAYYLGMFVGLLFMMAKLRYWR
ncbi:hypothetical protein [Moraxella bovis]|uniref:Uncharacterized protein n=1 Tax=Moraxella bovis TaxID=476 RepID=A0A378PTJ6_MORBO|nr:hypothetical protein [Moraxella bovis]UYZ69217.1 hypothetical protein LP122_03805 [Moraxella bovis]UYZ88689.1 hypothetical protein LP114_09580 [Moraxella bovis]UZA23604.1 hypothetical protein LP117_07280 [Moraxella bovis]UZA26753.1 hypothetical protein LP119_09040 [Moraxella bovis]UZA30891.1 hypothetical protein LP097_04495 [Moraxella bovis]